jgi:hypothetical protein
MNNFVPVALVDDYNVNTEIPRPDGLTPVLTLSASLERDAAEAEEMVNRYGLVVGAVLRRAAADLRARGILTADQFFAHALKG